MTSTYRLTDIQQAVEIGTRLSHSWFRGHSRVIGQLTPRIYRPDLRDEVSDRFRPQIELETIEAFKRDAPTLADGPVPSETDPLGWLCLMQHFRTPTRLLDWTEHPLAALYFAVTGEKGQDAELWALYPPALNNVSDVGFGTPLVGRNPVQRYLIEEPYWAGTGEALARTCGMESPARRPIAFIPGRNFSRMVAQASTFTIHPRPDAGHTIPEVLTDPKHLVRYVIPAGAKHRIREDLLALGVSDLSLFPDLEGLSRRIADENRVMAYAPPLPPVAAGLVEGAD